MQVIVDFYDLLEKKNVKLLIESVKNVLEIKGIKKNKLNEF